MLPSLICSTLAILVAFSRYPSTASGAVTATGSDFTAILLMFADGAPGNVVLSPMPIFDGSPVCILDSVSVTGLFALCSPLPLAVGRGSDQVQSDFLSTTKQHVASGRWDAPPTITNGHLAPMFSAFW